MPVEPMACGVPEAKAIVWEQSRDLNKTENWTSRWFVSSLDPEDTSPREYTRILRGHWGVENRLHWPKDAILREDASRIRNPILMGNLMLLRNLVVFLHKTSPMQDEPLPAWVELNQASPMSLIRTLQRRTSSK